MGDVDERLVTELGTRAEDMIADVEALVVAESPSNDLGATAACAALVAEVAERVVGTGPEVVMAEGRSHLRLHVGTPRVLLLGHLDTVWPRGTLETFPLERSGDRISGPGVFDMKTGIVQGLYAIAAAATGDVAMLITSDEEMGSPTSRALVEEEARGVEAVLVLEPSASGRVKIARKGGARYEVNIRGRAAHAGLEPEKGINAVLEMAHQVIDVARHARPDLGTTVTPTAARGGTTTNTVPADAVFAVDVRAATAAEQQRVDDALRAIEPFTEGAAVHLSGGINRPPLDESASRDLVARARVVARQIGLGPLNGVAVGGGSDGNFTAGMGIPTLDGLGAVGDLAHAEGEYVLASAMPERAALVAGLLRQLCGGPPA